MSEQELLAEPPLCDNRVRRAKSKGEDRGGAHQRGKPRFTVMGPRVLIVSDIEETAKQIFRAHNYTTYMGV